jgi:phosphonate transport system substrate-binding protein
MRSTRLRATVLVSLCVTLFVTTMFASPARSAEDGALTLGIFPRRNFQETLTSFTPLADYLEKKIGRPVRIDAARTFDDFWLGMRDRRYDIVHFNQYHYLRAHRDLNYEVIAMNEEFNRAVIAGAISVRADSGIKRLTDLKGRTVIFGGDHYAMQSYIVATYLLRMAGLKRGDYIEKFAKNPPNAHLAVYFGQADAAGVGDGINDMPVVRNKIDVSQMRFVAVGTPLAHLPWAVRGEMDPSLRNAITQTLHSLKQSPAGRNALNQAHLTDLRPATDKDFDPHRKIVAAVLGEHY